MSTFLKNSNILVPLSKHIKYTEKYVDYRYTQNIKSDKLLFNEYDLIKLSKK
jgi:hypothetical protein